MKKEDINFIVLSRGDRYVYDESNYEKKMSESLFYKIIKDKDLIHIKKTKESLEFYINYENIIKILQISGKIKNVFFKSGPSHYLHITDDQAKMIQRNMKLKNILCII